MLRATVNFPPGNRAHAGHHWIDLEIRLLLDHCDHGADILVSRLQPLYGEPRIDVSNPTRAVRNAPGNGLLDPSPRLLRTRRRTTGRRPLAGATGQQHGATDTPEPPMSQTPMSQQRTQPKHLTPPRLTQNRNPPQAAAPFNSNASRFGAAPNIREYSRLNCEALSYPTRYAALLTLAPATVIKRRASNSRNCF
jgi:hypothetical protein